MSAHDAVVARPGLAADGEYPRCITCGDVADEMVVLAVDAKRELALCADACGRHHSVETALVDGVGAGDVLLVHAATAIARERRATA